MFQLSPCPVKAEKAFLELLEAVGEKVKGSLECYSILCTSIQVSVHRERHPLHTHPRFKPTVLINVILY